MDRVLGPSDSTTYDFDSLTADWCRSDSYPFLYADEYTAENVDYFVWVTRVTTTYYKGRSKQVTDVTHRTVYQVVDAVVPEGGTLECVFR